MAVGMFIAFIIGIVLGLHLSEYLNDIKAKNARIEHLERELYKRDTKKEPPQAG